MRDDFSSLSRPSRKAITISRRKMDTAIKFGFVKHQIRLEFQNFTPSLTLKIHKPTPVDRPIVSGCGRPTEKLSSFVDKLLQAIVQQQKSYLKDITDFINYRENTKVPEEVILVSMDVTILYTNIPQEEGNTHGMQSIRNILHKQTSYPYTIARASAKAKSSRKLIPVLWKNYLQTHGTAIGSKMAVAFSNYIHEQGRERNPKPKRTKTARLETFYI